MCKFGANCALDSQLASIVGEFFTEADRIGPEAAAQFRFFLQEKARRCVWAACLGSHVQCAHLNEVRIQTTSNVDQKPHAH